MKRIAAAALAAILLLGGSVTAFAAGYDLRTVSELTPNELENYMHPESRHLAGDVVRICRREGISAEFIATLMRWERRPDLHNWFGWMASEGKLMRFASDIECLERIIPLIKKLYLTSGGRYFNGYTVEAVSEYYNDSDFWRETIAAGVQKIVSETAVEQVEAVWRQYYPSAGVRVTVCRQAQ